MANFRPFNHDQNAMVVINFNDQIQPDTFEYTLHHLLSNKLDLSVFAQSTATIKAAVPSMIWRCYYGLFSISLVLLGTATFFIVRKNQFALVLKSYSSIVNLLIVVM